MVGRNPGVSLPQFVLYFIEKNTAEAIVIQYQQRVFEMKKQNYKYYSFNLNLKTNLYPE